MTNHGYHDDNEWSRPDGPWWGHPTVIAALITSIAYVIVELVQ